MTAIVEFAEFVEPRTFIGDDPWCRYAQLEDVNFPARTIEIVVIPYEQAADVGWQGRAVSETIARGAFDGIERRANRIRANRDHKTERTFGRAIALHPARAAGLVAEIKVANTELGNETLELAADGCLDASAGFLPMDGGMRWTARDAYRITKAWLGHISLVPEGAYGERAGVLAVRQHEPLPVSSTPNLDSWRAIRLQDRVASTPALQPQNYQAL